VSPVLRQGLARLRNDRARALLTAGGITTATAMVGAAATLVFALATGFDRTAARADLPDVTARFTQQPLPLVADRVQSLPNIRKVAYRFEANGIGLEANGEYTDRAIIEGVRPGPRGYAIVRGRDVAGPGSAVVERGLAKS
jgi:hypothetical protein